MEQINILKKEREIGEKYSVYNIIYNCNICGVNNKESTKEFPEKIKCMSCGNKECEFIESTFKKFKYRWKMGEKQ